MNYKHNDNVVQILVQLIVHVNLKNHQIKN